MTSAQELSENTIERMTDYITAGAYGTKGRHGFRIPALVVEQWAHQGFAVLHASDLAQRYGVSRRTMSKTIKSAAAAGFIRETGRTTEGLAVYVPILERGDEWRREHDRRMAEYEAA